MERIFACALIGWAVFSGAAVLVNGLTGWPPSPWTYVFGAVSALVGLVVGGAIGSRGV